MRTWFGKMLKILRRLSSNVAKKEYDYIVGKPMFALKDWYKKNTFENLKIEIFFNVSEKNIIINYKKTLSRCS